MTPSDGTLPLLLMALLAVETLLLLVAVLATVFVVRQLRHLHSEQQTLRRVMANMDWTTVLSNMQGLARESVRILDILDKRLQKLEALEKIQLTQTNPNFKR